jgi:SAM-dependent methyltransferase
MIKGDWQFDREVASRFETEARTHIPNYEVVIQKCVDIALAAFPEKSANILDVGSALGYTVERFLAAGFTKVRGVESSAAMIERCRVRERVLYGNTFPKEHGPFDLVTANWTLHFISERESYIYDIKDSLSDRGIFILTDKITSSSWAHERYHDFKRSMGVSEEEILRKEASIKGVLETRPLEWYFQTLEAAGFRNVSIIDTPHCFATFIAFK